MGEDGQPIYNDPIEIKCRWEGKSVQFYDAHGRVKVSQHVVMVDRDLPLGGALKEGSLKSLTSTSVCDNSDVWEIRGFRKTPKLNQREILREAFL